MNTVETSGSLFEKALKAWGVEVRSSTDEKFHFRRELWWKGEKLEVVWSPEVAQDLCAFHGSDAEAGLVEMLLVEVFRALAGRMEKKPPMRMCKTCKTMPVNPDKPMSELLCDQCITILKMGKGA